MPDALVALVLLCGLPGAGKTSLARELERIAASEHTTDWRVERLSFDDLFRADFASASSEFEPAAWKRCQLAMKERVREWGARISEPPSGRKDAQRLVLLLDDNFQLRSLRKRFARLAAEASYGFGILSVETPVEICRARNATRSGRERVPDHAFERMARAFEAPDGRSHPFERNSKTLQLGSGALGESSAVWGVLEELVSVAEELRGEARRRAEVTEQDQQQRAKDQMRVDRDVVHQVDLQLRKWITSELARSTEQSQQQQQSSSRHAKAELARHLNQRRKDFLAQLKTRGVMEDVGDAACGKGDASAIVAAHLKTADVAAIRSSEASRLQPAGQIVRKCRRDYHTSGLVSISESEMMHDDSIHQVEITMPRADEDLASGLPVVPVDTAVAPEHETVVASTGAVGHSIQALRTVKRMKIISVVLAAVGILAVVIAIAMYNTKSGEAIPASTSTAASDGVNLLNPFVKVDLAASKSRQRAAKTFLSLDFAPDQEPRFVLSKELWNRSFVVYPTIEKHSGPPKAGLERGSVLLDTTDNVFHFEMSEDKKYLLFVSENHRARLKSGNEDLKGIFEVAHWPGYYIKVPIEVETDDVLYISSYPFFSSGFFVTNTLWSDLYSVLPNGTKSYPRNSILRVEYELEDGIVVASYAIGLLPEKVMSQRIADDRVGYFSSHYTLYGSNSESGENKNMTTQSADGFHFINSGVTMINRRRLEIDPKTKKTKNPVVYHIDPSVPARWRSAFVAGVEAWKPAFEEIGFKDALKVVLPGDKDWPNDYRLGDLRYNTISVMISDETYAFGPFVVDPRSGEILHSNIIFEYGFFDDAVVDFDQFSPVDPPTVHPAAPSARSNFRMSDAAKKNPGRLRQCGLGHHDQHRSDRMLLGMFAGEEHRYVSDEIIGQHFTDIVMHEVGHTLGLRHNFAGSSMITREQLDDDSFVAKHGISTSVMDYLPANIFSDLTSAKAKTHGFYMTKIGAYDKAAIAYGYAVVSDEVPGMKSEKLTELARKTPFFLTDEDTDEVGSPYAQRFDLSTDPVAFADDRLDLAKLLRKSNVVSKIPDDASWTALWRREASLLRMINKTMDSAWPALGGVNVSHAHREKGETRYTPEFVSRTDQLKALAVLARIITGEVGLFPAPADYSSYIEVRGGDWEDCEEPSLEYGCLARGLADIDSIILEIKKKAISRTLFPAMTRIVALDVAAPLQLADLLATVRNFTSSGDGRASAKHSSSHTKVLRQYLEETLVSVMDNECTDARIVDAITSVFPDLVEVS